MEWRSIPSYPNYEVSDTGLIRRVTGGQGAVAGRIIKQHRTPSDKRLRVPLRYAIGKGRFVAVHRVVAQAFLGPCPEGKEVNHIDGDVTNNSMANLEYLTRSENTKHAYRLGLMQPPLHLVGVRHPLAKLTEVDVIAIRNSQETGRALAKHYGVAPTTISKIRLGKRWKHI